MTAGRRTLVGLLVLLVCLGMYNLYVALFYVWMLAHPLYSEAKNWRLLLVLSMVAEVLIGALFVSVCLRLRRSGRHQQSPVLLGRIRPACGPLRHSIL